jgi:hypothetical protein
MNQRKVKCGFCGKLQLIDEIRECSKKAHVSSEKKETKVKAAIEQPKAEVKFFETKEERDAWIAENPGSRALSTNVKRSSAWSEELGKYVSIVIETYKAISA